MKKSVDERLDNVLDIADDMIEEFSDPHAESNDSLIINARRERGIAPRTHVDSNPHSGDLDDDYKFARDNLYNLVDRGNEALEGILELAKEMEHPRAYEVASGLIKNVSDTTMELLKMQKELQSMKVTQDTPSSNATTNNNLFVGSTADLQKMLKGE